MWSDLVLILTGALAALVVHVHIALVMGSDEGTDREEDGECCWSTPITCNLFVRQRRP